VPAVSIAVGPFVDLTRDDFPLGSQVGAVATSSVGSPLAAVRSMDPEGVMVDQAPLSGRSLRSSGKPKRG
jgi:hypothetical protein